MNPAGDQLIKKIDIAAEILRLPVTPKEEADGWSSKLKRGWLTSLLDLRTALRNGASSIAIEGNRRQKIEDYNVMRDLDFSGIHRGEVYEELCQVADALDTYFNR